MYWNRSVIDHVAISRPTLGHFWADIISASVVHGTWSLHLDYSGIQAIKNYKACIAGHSNVAYTSFSKQRFTETLFYCFRSQKTWERKFIFSFALLHKYIKSTISLNLLHHFRHFEHNLLIMTLMFV